MYLRRVSDAVVVSRLILVGIALIILVAALRSRCISVIQVLRGDAWRSGRIQAVQGWPCGRFRLCLCARGSWPTGGAFGCLVCTVNTMTAADTTASWIPGAPE